jgi:hypothetical protein
MAAFGGKLYVQITLCLTGALVSVGHCCDIPLLQEHEPDAFGSSACALCRNHPEG